MSSFFGERTAEYALVPLLQRALVREFGWAIPMSYWRTREGNRTSAEMHKGLSVRILAMFARRPKVTPSDTILAGKVNWELFRFASFARELGVPTIAGYPAVKSVIELHSDPRVFWLHIEGLRADEFFIDLSSREQPLIDMYGNPVPTMSVDEIAEYIRTRAQTFKWDEAMQCIHRLRTEPDGHYVSPWSSGYKPAYMLIPPANSRLPIRRDD